MVKESFICIVIVIAIVFGNQVTQNYTKESVSKLTGELTTLRQEVTNKELNPEKVKNDINDIYKQWEEKYDKLAYFIEHDELEKIETGFVSVKSYIEMEKYEESINELDKSVFLLEHIEDKYAFDLQNIF